MEICLASLRNSNEVSGTSSEYRVIVGDELRKVEERDNRGPHRL